MFSQQKEKSCDNTAYRVSLRFPALFFQSPRLERSKPLLFPDILESIGDASQHLTQYRPARIVVDHECPCG